MTVRIIGLELGPSDMALLVEALDYLHGRQVHGGGPTIPTEQLRDALDSLELGVYGLQLIPGAVQCESLDADRIGFQCGRCGAHIGAALHECPQL